MTPVPDPVHIAIEYTMREDRGRIIAALTARLGDFELAQDCLSDACESALTNWAHNGVPKSRVGWLLQVAHRRAIDRLRRAQNFAAKSAQIAVLERTEAAFFAQGEHEIPDNRLRLMFTCCHPALEEKTRVALTLRTVGGLSTQEVARAFLDKTPAMAQRLARARSKISRAKIPFVIPEGADLAERIRSVLSVVYLIFNEGYGATKAVDRKDEIRIDLCDEAIFLARLMYGYCPENSEVAGLLALILITHSRHNARRTSNGGYIPLSEQDRTLWDHAMIAQGQALLEKTLTKGQVGSYQLQAAIGALHGEATGAQDTDWPQIIALYRLLVCIEGSAVAQLNLAVAVSYGDSAEAALDLLDKIKDRLSQYQPYHAARADILGRLGDNVAAIASYDAALALTHSQSERSFLQMRRATLLVK